MLWPEIARLILAYAKNEDPDVFGPFDTEVSEIMNKLIGIKSNEFTTKFTYQEKVTLMTVLIDCLHETNDFRMFLNKRVDDKSTFNREKMDVYQQIRDLEGQQQEFMKKYAEDENNKTQEQMQSELEELRIKLSQASRIEAKHLRERILSLERVKNNYTNQVGNFENQIKKKHILI